jgi:hypothetical protein
MEEIAMLGFSSALLGTILLSATGGLGLPFGVPPTPEDSTLSRIAPEECLFYLSWAGTASPDPKSSNQTEQLLAEPEVQNFLRQIDHGFRKGVEKAMNEQGGDEKQKAMCLEGYECMRNFTTHPGAIFVSKLESDKKPAAENADSDSDDAGEKDASDNPLSGVVSVKELSEFEGGFVLALGDDAPRFEALANKCLDFNLQALKEKAKNTETDDGEGAKDESIQENLEDRVNKMERKLQETAKEESQSDGDKSKADPQIVNFELDGQTWHRIKLDELPGHWWTWGFHKGYFIVTVGKEDAAQKLLKRMEAEPPRWFTAIRQQAPVERRTLVAYVDLKKIRELVGAHLEPEMRTNARLIMDMLGVSNATALVEVWGLDGDNFVNKTFLALDGEPRGLLRTVSDQPLKLENLSAIPRDATSAMAFRLDLHKILETVLDTAAQTSPEYKGEFTKQLDMVEQTLGIDIRHGVIDALGDTWCIYSSPSEGNYATIVVPVKDSAAMKVAFGQIMDLLKKQLAPAEKPEKAPGEAPTTDPSNFSPQIERFEFEGHEIYCFNCLQVAPSWCLTDKNLVIGLLPQDLKAYLSRGDRHEPMDGDSRIAGLLAGEHAPSFLMYWNPRSVFRFCYSWFLMTGPTFSNTMRQANMDVDMSVFPSLPAIDRHLGPTVATVRRTPQGIEFASRGTIPLPVDSATFIGLCVLSQYQTFFQNCSEPSSSQSAMPESAVEIKPAESDEGAAEEAKTP